MTKTNKAIELVKTALIILLAASALALAWKTELFSDVIGALPFFGSVADLMRGGTGTAETGGSEQKEAVRPLSIVITDREGKRYGVKYETDVRNAVYDRTGSIVGEALGSASAPTKINENEWREALSGPGVYFEYLNPVKLSVIGKWLGARMPDTAQDILLRSVYVAFGEDKSRVYYQDVESGSFFGADTASASGKVQELEIYSANGALFAFETDIRAAENAPYMLIMPDSAHADVSAGAAGSTEELLDIVLAALGHEDETYTRYYVSEGVLVYVGTQFNVRADKNGGVHYRRTDGLPSGDSEEVPDMNEAIELARVVAADTIGKTCGDAEVFFESLEYGAGGSSTVLFGYYIAGGRIVLRGDVCAGLIRLSYGTVAEIELIFRNYLLTDELTRLLPERQAFAAAGREFLLSYADTGQETLQPSWVRLGKS